MCDFQTRIIVVLFLIQLLQENTVGSNTILFIIAKTVAVFAIPRYIFLPRKSLLIQNTKGRQSLFRKSSLCTEISYDSKLKNKSMPYWVGIHPR